MRAQLEHLYGLDKPLLTQFGLYLQALARGDFGPSLHWRDFSVDDLFARALPISMRLGTEALALALVVGVRAGASPEAGAAASRRGRSRFLRCSASPCRPS